MTDFNRPNPQTFDEYDTYQDTGYDNHWQNQYQRTGTPNEFEHERRPSPFYASSAPSHVPTRTHIPQPTSEYQTPHMYPREALRQPVLPSQQRVNPLHPGHPTAIAHHPILVREPFYRPQFQPAQFAEYTNGFQAPFASPFVTHPGVQHINPNIRRHDDTLRNLRSPLLEEFRTAKNKKYELKVCPIVSNLLICRIS